jgi:probable rRNA maturation factor
MLVLASLTAGQGVRYGVCKAAQLCASDGCRLMTGRASLTITIETPCAALASEAELQSVIAYTLAAEGVTAPVTLTVVLVDDATIHELNRRFLAHDEPTDVITFPLDNQDDEFFLPAEAARQLGEIYISCERAAAQSAAWGTTPAREVRFLAVHGVLHLLGWDDATTEDRARMLARQDALLAAWTAESQEVL